LEPFQNALFLSGSARRGQVGVSDMG